MPNRAYATAAVRALGAMRDGRELDTRDLLELLDGQVTPDKRAGMYAALHRGGVLASGRRALRDCCGEGFTHEIGCPATSAAGQPVGEARAHG